MASPVLPQDVFNEIISQLAGETSTLKSCSLVCRSFRRNAQKMLFNYTVVSLTYDDSDVANYPNASEHIGPASQPIKLALIVKHAPHLIEYIQELRISCFGDSYPVFDGSDTTDLPNALGVFSRKGEFPINLRSLSLRFDDLWWNDIDPWVQDALVLLMSADSLRHILLDQIMDMTLDFSSLQTTRKERPKLESLTVAFYDVRWRIDELPDAVKRIVNTTQLKTLEGGDCNPYSMSVFERILRPTSNSLEHLTLRELNITDPDSVSIDLKRFSRLTDITIYQRHIYLIPPMLILITKTMKNVSHRNVIQNLSFHLELGSHVDIVNFESATKDVWQEVDTIWSIPQLVSSESFRGITFNVELTARNYDVFSNLVQNKMPETKKASKLHIKRSPFWST
ncbi:hypothetical protein M378DRAFT_547315 [Amanita muscaria Koide BX008]|uniref:F-box domain-containing protein n=1 Tax=Amanita muscaria (strain Koide BX008) TaxID=946122 RepID=A0A0C2WTY2_AMAMK|nr:hypothetical protein M378DRAFT_547315 [Amanita muscaria Koide BX008]